MEKKGKRTIEVVDDGGEKFILDQYDDGTLLCPDVTMDLDLDALKAFEFLDDDIMIVSYPRSGCHWLWEQLRMLTAGSTDIDVSEKQSCMFEISPIEKMKALPSPRIMNHHLRYQHMPDDMKQRKPRLVFIYRNPKDVAVSFYKLQTRGTWWSYNGKWENYFKLFIAGTVDWGSYADFLNHWAKVIEENPDLLIHVLSYEGLKANPIEELGRLSRFLDLNCDDSFLQDVTDKCSINSMRDRKSEIWKKNGQKIDIMYRKGVVGDWKNYFTVAQNEQFDQYWRKAFTASKIFPMPEQY